ncbi:MAG: hypothetical protein ACLGIA_05655 [Actinomycetes bacterium]
MTTGPSRPRDEDDVPEGDRVEQLQSAGFVEDDVVVPPDAERAVPEASDGDLAEQAHEVPLDDEER